MYLPTKNFVFHLFPKFWPLGFVRLYGNKNMKKFSERQFGKHG